MKDMKAGASKMLVDLSYWKSRLGNDLGLSLERMVEAELCRNQLLRGAGGGVCLILCIMTCLLVHYITPPKFNMEPENDGFQKDSPFPGVDFQVPC